MKCKIGRREVDRLRAGGPPLSDTLIRGFLARRLPSGRVQYLLRYQIDGTRHSLPLGLDGEITPEKARAAAEVARGQLGLGGNPAVERREKRKAEGDTVEKIAALFIERDVKPRLRSWRESERILKRYVLPRLAETPISELRRKDIAALLDHVETTNGPVMADRVLAVVRRMANWYAARDDGFTSPIVKGMARTRPRERARDRVLSDVELRALWEACDAAVPVEFGAMVRLLLLTAQRRDEVRLMRWEELNGDVWTIPSTRYKTGRANVVPLSEDARTVIGALPRRGPFVLTSGERTSRPKKYDAKEPRPIGAISAMKTALDIEMLTTLQRDDPKVKPQPWVLHDLRRTSRTLMTRAGVPSEVAERVLGHAIGGVAGVYNRHEYEREKRQALEAVAAVVRRIVEPRAAGRVVLMRRRAKASGGTKP